MGNSTNRLVGLVTALLALVGTSLCTARAPAFALRKEKVVLARPTPDQTAWQEMEVGMFIHFAPNTWTDKEGDDLTTPLQRINPAQLDTDQWVRVAESIGAKYIVFVAKHVGGFCMWHTDTTDYAIQSTPWRGGQGDVLLKRYAPHAMRFQGKYATIRWVGSEDGTAPYPCWNALREEDARTGVAAAAQSDPEGTAWLPCECDVSLRRDWFWNSRNEDSIKSLDQLMDIYYRSVGHGAGLLLNLPPDTTGRIPDADARRAAEFGAEVRRRFGKPLAETSGQGEMLELSLGRPTRVDHVITMENIRQGERVREYAIQAWHDGNWQEICRGTAIGHKKIDRFPPVVTEKLRLQIVKSAARPLIRRFAAY